VKEAGLLKVMMKYSFKTYIIYMLKDCSRNLKGKMQFVGLFYVVNDNKLVDDKVPQVMRCHLYCCKTFVLYNPRTKLRRGLISYYKTIEYHL
jgi:hypothetical protein